MRVVIVDNYDSFTFNLAQYLGELGAECEVVQNDRVTLDELRARAPDRVVVSPGPGRPDRSKDFGVSAAVIREMTDVPVLGVCLGHQGIVVAFGGRVVRAPTVMHGKTSWIRHDGSPPFEGLPTELEVMRYHSLVAAPAPWPKALVVTARSLDDDVIMAVRHRTRPLYGIQFHPESVGTSAGRMLLARFLGSEVSRNGGLPAPDSGMNGCVGVRHFRPVT